MSSSDLNPGTTHDVQVWIWNNSVEAPSSRGRTREFRLLAQLEWSPRWLRRHGSRAPPARRPGMQGPTSRNRLFDRPALDRIGRRPDR